MFRVFGETNAFVRQSYVFIRESYAIFFFLPTIMSTLKGFCNFGTKNKFKNQSQRWPVYKATINSIYIALRTFPRTGQKKLKWEKKNIASPRKKLNKYKIFKHQSVYFTWKYLMDIKIVYFFFNNLNALNDYSCSYKTPA